MSSKFSRYYLQVDARSIRPMDGEGGDGSTGNGAGAGQVTSQAGGSITLDQVNQIVNNAIANLRKSDLPKIVGQQLNPVNEQLTSISKTLESLTTRSNDGKDGNDQGDNKGGAHGGGSGNISPELNAQLKELMKKVTTQDAAINQLRVDKEAAEKKASEAELRSVVQGALSEFQFPTENAAKTAFNLLMSEVKRDEEGHIIAGENLPVAAFAKDFFNTSHPYLLKPIQSGGAGAGGANFNVKGSENATLEMIRPGMKPEERQAITSAIQRVAAGLTR